MKKIRYEFFILTTTIFLVGAILYGALTIPVIYTNSSVWDINNPVLLFVFAFFGGGYFFFSLLSGVLFTVNWISKKSLKVKVLLTIFFVVPIWLAMAGIFYSIPYGIYNFIQYRKIRE